MYGNKSLNVMIILPLILQYYGHRAKLKVIGREDDLMELNLRALKMAKEVAVKTGTLMAGDICNTTIYHGDDPSSVEEVREIFRVSQRLKKDFNG